MNCDVAIGDIHNDAFKALSDCPSRLCYIVAEGPVERQSYLYLVGAGKSVIM
jgi:hypothetical protein